MTSASNPNYQILGNSKKRVLPQFMVILGSLLAFIFAVTAILYPRLRKSIGLVSAGIIVFYFRWRFFHIEGIRGVPFQKIGRAAEGKTKSN